MAKSDNLRVSYPGVIAGAILGGVMALATGTWWWLLVGLALGLAALPLVRRAPDPGKSRKHWDDNFRD
ncbi:hypothetical protein G7Y31_00710 [Corynebacterium lizhenjunii]|uniref:Uncharacterized protein n=1 Tax=Corynebacterium lizhenjunii TaxID=2709394 RepID=A0A7T0KFA8_9CORY|nr:hypothetical protein [Corynebacterium lizhenjunii]QPK79286.1 hypothetical protein G7Y31_00710 [Corynebacterium lizhenjunii]